jgi:hypothetical protein
MSYTQDQTGFDALHADVLSGSVGGRPLAAHGYVVLRAGGQLHATIRYSDKNADGTPVQPTSDMFDFAGDIDAYTPDQAGYTLLVTDYQTGSFPYGASGLNGRPVRYDSLTVVRDSSGMVRAGFVYADDQQPASISRVFPPDINTAPAG